MTEGLLHASKSSSSSPYASESWVERTLWVVLTGIPYVLVFHLLDRAAAAHETTIGGGISLFYAPVGLTMAVLVRYGMGYAPLYFLVTLIDNYFVWHQNFAPWPFAAIALAAVPTLGYSACAWVLRNRLRIDFQLAQLRSASAFVLAVAFSSAIVAFGYTSIVEAVTGNSTGPPSHIVFDFWIGDVVTILSIAPFLLSIVFPWAGGLLRHMRGSSAHAAVAARRLAHLTPPTLLWFAVLIPTIAFCISETESARRAILYPCLIPLVFAAYWRGIKGATTGIFVVATAFAAFGSSHLGHAGLRDIQLFIITLSLTTLMLGAAISSAELASADLKRVHDVYRQAITAANAVPYVLDYERNRYSFVGENIERVTGFTAAEFTPALWDERSSITTMHGDVAGLSHDEAIRKVREGEAGSWSSEGKFLNRDGTIHWVADASVEIPGDDGKPVRSIGLILDVTRLKEAEDAVRSSRATLNLFVEHAPAAVAMFDHDMRYLVCSERWLHDYRLTGNIIGKCHYDVFPEIRSNIKWMEIHKRCLAGAIEKCEEDRFIRGDGSEEWLRWEVRPWYDDSEDIGGIIMFTEVITERKKAEESVRLGEQRLELALSGAELGLWDFDLECNRIAVNARCAEMFGYSLDTVPTDVESWRARVHPDDLSGLSNHLWEHVSRRRLNLDTEFRIYTRMGRRVWVQFRGKVVAWDSGGVPLRLTGTLQDITAQKAAEEDRRTLEEQMQQTQKLESLGVLAGGIAHDFNNLLVGILGNADLALTDAAPDTPLQESLDAIVTASERAAELCRQMLAYSGRGKFVVMPVSLNDLVKEIGQLLAVTISKRVTFLFDPEPDLPLVKADATQLRQIVMNLVTNASEAIGDHDGTVHMSTGKAVWTADDAAVNLIGGELRESQQYVYVRVSDTGSGMDPATLHRIFDPFFTTKFTGRGLGLAAVLGIVRGHGGAIRVESAIGSGTTFTVYIPACADDPVARAAPFEFDRTAAGEGAVLVVDDEEPVLAIARAMLERQGFAAFTAKDGDEALRLYEQEKDAIVLAVIDLTMPRMGGGELLHALHERNPELRVVLSSGYNEQEAIAQSHGEKLAGFIQKPYRANDFYSVIRSALNTARR